MALLAPLFALVPSVALADAISPPAVTANLEIGESLTITKTVTVSQGMPTSSPVDIFFLSDTTASMSEEIDAVRSAASQVLSDVAGLGDVAFGVGEYKDELPFATFGFRFNNELDALSSNETEVRAGLDEWFPFGGGDIPPADDFLEANFLGLETLAEDTMWRDGSSRILLWFGDAAGKDPILGSTENSAIEALTAANITVQAFDAGALDSTGQATRVTNATGGAVRTFENASDVDDVTDMIIESIESTFADYMTVSLDTSGVPAGLSVDVSPSEIVGEFDRSITRTFEFDVSFTGETAGTYDFTIDALVDGGIVATEEDTITVGDGGNGDGDGDDIPAPATLVLLGTGLVGLRLLAWRRTS